ncbi:MAG: hypothetical protein N5P05_004410 (plasmid) [Chroococcopsis gigantea SAG 12.99]|jgi:predicted ATPase|nr:hypothetical protein [Chroococcopsis gigantea SAG 12.99]
MSGSYRAIKMTKKLSTTLPDLTYQLLQDWADTEGTSLSDLSGYIIRKAVEEAQREGKIKPNRSREDKQEKGS